MATSLANNELVKTRTRVPFFAKLERYSAPAVVGTKYAETNSICFSGLPIKSNICLTMISSGFASPRILLGESAMK